MSQHFTTDFDTGATASLSKNGVVVEGGIPNAAQIQALLPAGRFSVEKLIGRGGMGLVYLAEQCGLGRRVAVKIIRRQPGDGDVEKRFRQEALVLARLDHPNVVRVYEHGEAGPEHLYLAMEHVEGGDLTAHLRRGELNEAKILQIGLEICSALEAAHALGVVHRDIKPSNILLDAEGHAKVADFGLAKLLMPDASLTQHSGRLGTPDYASPEQHAGGTVDVRTDVFSLGVLLYHLLTGHLPRGRWRAPSSVAEVSRGWDHVIEKALETEPARRQGDVSVLRHELEKMKATGGNVLSRRGAVITLSSVLAVPAVFFILRRPVQKEPIGLDEARLTPLALKKLQNSPPLPAEGLQRTFPRGIWCDVKPTKAELGDLVEKNDGWMRLTEHATLQPAHAAGTNWGVRATFAGLHTTQMPELLLRDTSESNYNIYLHGGYSLVIERYDVSVPVTHNMLASQRVSQVVKKGQPYTLQAVVIGRRIFASIDRDRAEAELPQPRISARHCVYGVSFDDFKDVQFINLDGLLDEDARLVVGL